MVIVLLLKTLTEIYFVHLWGRLDGPQLQLQSAGGAVIEIHLFHTGLNHKPEPEVCRFYIQT